MSRTRTCSRADRSATATRFPDLRRGVPSDRLPQNFFLASARPSRLQELYWRAEILGSAAAGIPAHLDAQQGGPRVGLRDLYRAALAKVDQVAVDVSGHPFVELVPSEQDRVFRRIDSASVFPPDPSRGGRSFVDLLIGHTLEGCFAAPEYGGNANTDGWRDDPDRGRRPAARLFALLDRDRQLPRASRPSDVHGQSRRARRRRERRAAAALAGRREPAEQHHVSSFFAEVADPGSKP
jgi:hypothetical protein